MLMDVTHYLPEEELTTSNYPEVVSLKSDLLKIESYAERVNLALTWYEESEFDKIDLDVVEIEEYAQLCRSVCETLSTASKVCYEVLLDVREIQNILQELLYLRRKYGDEYIGKPTNTTEDERYEGEDI